jgi:hypothetical protein
MIEGSDRNAKYVEFWHSKSRLVQHEVYDLHKIRKSGEQADYTARDPLSFECCTMYIPSQLRIQRVPNPIENKSNHVSGYIFDLDLCFKPLRFIDSVASSTHQGQKPPE